MVGTLSVTQKLPTKLPLRLYPIYTSRWYVRNYVRIMSQGGDHGITGSLEDHFFGSGFFGGALMFNALIVCCSHCSLRSKLRDSYVQLLNFFDTAALQCTVDQAFRANSANLLNRWSKLQFPSPNFVSGTLHPAPDAQGCNLTKRISASTHEGSLRSACQVTNPRKLWSRALHWSRCQNFMDRILQVRICIVLHNWLRRTILRCTLFPSSAMSVSFHLLFSGLRWIGHRRTCAPNFWSVLPGHLRLEP